VQASATSLKLEGRLHRARGLDGVLQRLPVCSPLHLHLTHLLAQHLQLLPEEGAGKIVVP